MDDNKRTLTKALVHKFILEQNGLFTYSDILTKVKEQGIIELSLFCSVFNEFLNCGKIEYCGKKDGVSDLYISRF